MPERTLATSSARSAAVSVSPPPSSTSAAAPIAVSGERRSWLRVRRTAVLIASLCRSPSATMAAWASRSRSIAEASSEARVCRTRSVDGRVRLLAGVEEEPADVPVADGEVVDPLGGLGPAQRAELDVRPGDAEHLGEPRADLAQPVLDEPAFEQEDRDVGGERRLGTLLLGLGGAPARRAWRAR